MTSPPSSCCSLQAQVNVQSISHLHVSPGCGCHVSFGVLVEIRAAVSHQRGRFHVRAPPGPTHLEEQRHLRHEHTGANRRLAVILPASGLILSRIHSLSFTSFYLLRPDSFLSLNTLSYLFPALSLFSPYLTYTILSFCSCLYLLFSLVLCQQTQSWCPINYGGRTLLRHGHLRTRLYKFTHVLRQLGKWQSND